MEAEILDVLMPNLTTELLLVGQSKGKFGGGQRRVFRQTQKKTREGNKPRFGTFAVVGNEDGYTPNKFTNDDVLKIIVESINQTNNKLGTDLFLGLDTAASFFYKNGSYTIKGKLR